MAALLELSSAASGPGQRAATAARRLREASLSPGPVLRLRNVRVGGRRTSLRLEAPMWDALEEVALRESLSLDDLVTRIAGRQGGNLSSALRTFLLGYFRSAATEQGHAAAGHGLFRHR